MRARPQNLQQCSVGRAVSKATPGSIELSSGAAPPQKKGFGWKRTRISYRQLQDPVTRLNEQANLETLPPSAEKHLHLKYLNESGLNCWSSVRYSWFRLGRHRRQEQTSRRGRRVNIIGILEPGKRME